MCHAEGPRRSIGHLVDLRSDAVQWYLTSSVSGNDNHLCSYFQRKVNQLLNSLTAGHPFSQCSFVLLIEWICFANLCKFTLITILVRDRKRANFSR